MDRRGRIFFLLSGRPPIECPEIEPPEIFFESVYVLYSFTVQLPKNYNRCVQYKYNNTSILQYKWFGWVFQKTLRGIRSVDTVGYTNILSLRALYCTLSFGSELYVFFFFWRRSIFPSARKGRKKITYSSDPNDTVQYKARRDKIFVYPTVTTERIPRRVFWKTHPKHLYWIIDVLLYLYCTYRL